MARMIEREALLARVENIENNVSIMTDHLETLKQGLRGTNQDNFIMEWESILQYQDTIIKKLAEKFEILTDDIYNHPQASK